MKYIADLHIHSLFSRATSKASTLPGLAAWAAVKGIHVIGTGDFTHPGWFGQIAEQLVEAEPGFYQLAQPLQDTKGLLPEGIRPRIPPESIRFVLTTEISSIYKKGDRVRKNHNIVFAPDLESAQRVNRTLADIGNLESDGRPILGLDAKKLLEIVLEQAPEGFLVPAHIWTPWFSLFGSKSGFDRIEDCFEELTPHIFALETGLSSDPDMNRRVSALDRFTFISNSDCHSPGKLGREANVFATGFDYYHMRRAMQHPVDSEGNQVFQATVEFYPEEGKYHCDGHRKCGVCLEPQETSNVSGKCPACGKPLTIGVLHRVMDLADRQQPLYQPHDPAVYSCIPLTEILSELLGTGPATKKVMAAYAKLINLFESEFSLLLDVPLEEINRSATPLIGEAIRRVRENEVVRTPGYDGQFGVIRVFAEGEREQIAGQLSMFAPIQRKTKSKKAAGIKRKKHHQLPAAIPQQPPPSVQSLNSEQQAAVDDPSQVVVVKAGPGTGKTYALVQRVSRVMAHDARPCTIFSFTNKAADEVSERIKRLVGTREGKIRVSTFHGYCLHWLKRQERQLQTISPDSRMQICAILFPEMAKGRLRQFAQSLYTDSSLGEYRNTYQSYLTSQKLIDIDAIIPAMVEQMGENNELACQIREETGNLFVDEFQDINGDQYKLVAELAKSCPVFVIGDPDQAIYGFRGADSRWFSQFIDEWQASTHQLVKNYRNGRSILEAASHLIANNGERPFTIPMEAVSSRSGSLHLHRCTTPEHEASWIGDRIEQLLGGTSHREIERMELVEGAEYSLQDIGILFRTTSQMEAVREVLARRGIPYQTVDVRAFYTRGRLRLLYAAMLLVAGIADAELQVWLLAQIKGVGQTTLERIRTFLIDHSRPFTQLTALEVDGLIPESGREGVRQLQALLLELQTAADAASGVEQIVDRLATYYAISDEQEELTRFRDLCISFGPSLLECARYLLRYSDSIIYDAAAECITLSTLHAAKGLEYKVVFIAGTEQGLIPLDPREELSSEEHAEHQQEERRLFYVGITRAIDKLYCSHATTRMVHGKRSTNRQPSPFLDEIPKALFSPIKAVYAHTGKRKTRKRQLSLFS